MSTANQATQAELRNIGHDVLAKLIWQDSPPALSPEQAIGVGILATLLLLAEDISRLVGMYNTVTMQERTR